jgi:hypothetical protein
MALKAPKKVRFLKVEVSYREGDSLNAWNSQELGGTQMVQEVPTPIDLAILLDLGGQVAASARQLVRRSETLVPLVVVPDESDD